MHPSMKVFEGRSWSDQEQTTLTNATAAIKRARSGDRGSGQRFAAATIENALGSSREAAFWVPRGNEAVDEWTKLAEESMWDAVARQTGDKFCSCDRHGRRG